MRIGFVAAEAVPFAKAGGLGDVSSALARIVHREGHDIRLFLPLYAPVFAAGWKLSEVQQLHDVQVPMGSHHVSFRVFTARLPGSDMDVFLVHCPPFFDRSEVYTNNPDEPLRFAFLCRAVLHCCQHLRWAPDVLHAHDWHTALLPVYRKGPYSRDALFDRTRILLTVHNLGYQGVFPSTVLPELGLAEWGHLLDAKDLREGRVGFLKNGLLHADAINTVSPTYALEIQTEEYGFGLHDILRARRGVLSGILNGVDYDIWSPETDIHIAARYSFETLSTKELNKRALLDSLDLEYSPHVPVLGVVSRLVHQKGFDLFAEPIPDLLLGQSIYLVVLGAGEERYERFFRELEDRFPSQVRFRQGHDDPLAHRIEAGADCFLMPSRYEPCGLNQMYSLRYGTVPVVRRTGGLADTVRPYHPESGDGTGFVFEHFEPEEFRWALDRALEAFRDPLTWTRIRQNGMRQDFSWDRQARHYLDLYARLCAP